MKTRHLEQFREALIGQYRELIYEAVLESETDHKMRLNIGVLNDKLQMITKSAMCDGLDNATINQLIEEASVTYTPMAA